MDKLLFIKKLTPKKTFLFWATVFCGMILKYSFFGFKYFPLHDDHNMYAVFSTLEPFSALVNFKWYTVRIFAGLLDIYVISRLWSFQYLVLFFMITLQFITMILLNTVLKKNGIRTGTLLVLTYGFYPLGFEASYWIAASSRIIVGMFFVALSSYFLMKLIENLPPKNKNGYIFTLLFCITNIISLGFYEQLVFVSFLMSLLIIFRNLINSKYILFSLIPILNIAIIGTYYKYFIKFGSNSVRSSFVDSGLIQHTRTVLEKIKWLMITLPVEMIQNGVKNSFVLIETDINLFAIVLTVIISVAFGVFFAKEDIKMPIRNNLVILFLGFITIFLSYSPFFILENTWMAPRNAFPAFIGLGLIVESLFNIMFRHKIFDTKLSKIAKGSMISLIVFTFILVNVMELRDNKNVYETDKKIIENFTKSIDDTVRTKTSKPFTALLFNSKPIYVKTNSNRIENCTAAQWIFEGAFFYFNKNKIPGTAIPIESNKIIELDPKIIDSCILVGMDDQANTFLLKREATTDTSFNLLAQDGSLFGTFEVLPDNKAEFLRTEIGSPASKGFLLQKWR